MPIEQVVNDDASGVGGGWKLTFYVSGTSTPKDTFSDSALTIANTNPVVADSAGRFGNIFLESGTYKVILTDADDVEKWTADPVEGPLGSSGAVDEVSANYTITLGDATKTLAVDASGGPVTITLLAAATATDGYEISVKKVDSSANAVTIDPNGAETIDGAATMVLTEQWQGVTVRSDASNWQRRALTLKPAASRLVGTDSSGNLDSVSVSGTDIEFSSSAITTNYPRGHFTGFSLANGTDASHDINIGAGECRDTADAADITLAAIVKQIDATWAVGTGAGGLSSSLTAPANDTWYHIFAILVGGVADVGFDTSLTAANLVTDHSATAYRYLGSVLTDGSANILPGSWREGGEVFEYTTPTFDIDTTITTSTASHALRVPPGLSVLAKGNAYMANGSSAGTVVYIRHPSATDQAPSSSAAPLGQLSNPVTANGMHGQVECYTDTSRQIAARATAASTTLRWATIGWRYSRRDHV